VILCLSLLSVGLPISSVRAFFVFWMAMAEAIFVFSPLLLLLGLAYIRSRRNSGSRPGRLDVPTTHFRD
jgi:hypothetical protein